MSIELGNLREYITPTYFPWSSYCVVVLYLVAGVVFLPVTMILRHREEDKFHCDFPPDTLSGTEKDQVTYKCYTKYDERYNSPVPLYGMLFSSLASVLVVCSIYSCYMRSRTRSRVAPMINAETTTQRLRRVFYFYLLHLVTRLGVMISITAVSFYPSGFPQEFDCVSPGKQQRNSTHFNATDTLRCHTSGSVSRDKAVLSRCFWRMNIVFIFFMLVEIAYLVGRASCESEFTVDRKFMAEYFGNRTSTLGYSEHLKQITLRKTEKLERFTGQCEEERTIDDMFVNLELESQFGDIFDDYEELFLPRTTRNSVKVLITGLAGTGKSLLCQKLMRDWSKKSHGSPFDFAFLFKFRCYNKTTENISLRQLLNPATPLESELENVVQQLLDNPEKILLVFDGLDEFRDQRRNDGAFENKAEEKMPVWVLYTKLLEDKLLCGATVLTTSRPLMTSRIEISLFDKIVNIKEFSEEKVEDYVSSYCKQHPGHVAARIKQHVKNNSDLLSLCAIPLYCHTICYLLMEEVRKEGNPESAGCLPTRNTEIYKKVLAVAVSKHPQSEYRDTSLEEGTDSFSGAEEEALKQLGILARTGIRQNRTTFGPAEIQDITKHFGLLKQTKDDNANPCFCFIHPVFQDFLAARAIVNSTELKQEIKGAIGGLRRGNTKLYSVIQSVAGLLTPCEQSLFYRCFEETEK